MQLFTWRLLAFGVLVSLYILNPFLGVAALVGGFGYVITRPVVMASRSSAS